MEGIFYHPPIEDVGSATPTKVEIKKLTELEEGESPRPATDENFAALAKAYKALEKQHAETRDKLDEVLACLRKVGIIKPSK